MQTETTSSTPPTEGSRARPSPLTLPVILVGVVLVAMSISGAAVALPSLGADLDASGSALNWVVAGYNLAFAAMTLVAGSTADRIGRRRVFVGSAMVFTAGFTVTALSPSILLIDVARVVSGLGGAGIMAAGGAVIAASYSGSVRTKAFALMGTMAGVGIALGPTLSGLLVSSTGWRGGFAVFAVIGVAITIGATRLPESRAAAAGRSDWLGSALFVGALAALMFGILEAPTLGWKNPLVLLTVGGGLLLLAVFGVSQRRAASPVLSPSLVANRGFMGWCLATLTTSVGFLGVLVFLPTYLQAVGNLSPATAGLAMLLLTAPVLVTPLGAAALVNRGVSPRILIVLALALVTAGNFGLVGLSADHPVAATAVPLLLIGVGMGASFGITDGQAMSLAPSDIVGMAAGFLNTLRGAAEALVIAVFGAALLGLLTARLGDADHAASVGAGLLDAGGGVPEIEAFTWSWHMTQLGIGTLCLLLSVGVAFLVFRRPKAHTARPTTTPR